MIWELWLLRAWRASSISLVLWLLNLSMTARGKSVLVCVVQLVEKATIAAIAKSMACKWQVSHFKFQPKLLQIQFAPPCPLVPVVGFLWRVLQIKEAKGQIVKEKR